MEQTQQVTALASLADELVEKAVWIVGGDGWAYDIGYGGLDSGTSCPAAAMSASSSLDTEGLPTPAGRPPEGHSAWGGGESSPRPASPGEEGPRPPRSPTAMCMSPRSRSARTSSRPVRATPGAGLARPSIVIAYSTCIAHGIEMSTSMAHQEQAVSSGYWPLYRFRPSGTRHPFHLDSKAPTTRVRTSRWPDPVLVSPGQPGAGLAAHGAGPGRRRRALALLSRWPVWNGSSSWNPACRYRHRW